MQAVGTSAEGGVMSKRGPLWKRLLNHALTQAEIDALRKKIEDYSMPAPPSTCRLWLRGSLRSGHGIVSVGSKQFLASRIVFFLKHGYLPPEVRHSCDTPPCIEETHLLPGTHRDNMRDMVVRKRSAIGERHGSAKLTEAQIIEIRRSSETQRAIAARLGVGRGLISRIRNNLNWKHVQA